MVGHSLGGLLVRAFAQHFPEDIVGLVLIEPATADFPLPTEGDETLVEQMLEQLRANPELARQWYPEMFADWEKLPAQVRDPLIARHLEQADAGLRDMKSAVGIQAEVKNGSALPDVPVTVLTGMKIDSTPGRSNSDMEAFNKIKLDAPPGVCELCTHGEHRVLKDAGHRLNAERPEVVVDAIFDTLERVANHRLRVAK